MLWHLGVDDPGRLKTMTRNDNNQDPLSQAEARRLRRLRPSGQAPAFGAITAPAAAIVAPFATPAADPAPQQAQPPRPRPVGDAELPSYLTPGGGLTDGVPGLPGVRQSELSDSGDLASVERSRQRARASRTGEIGAVESQPLTASPTTDIRSDRARSRDAVRSLASERRSLEAQIRRASAFGQDTSELTSRLNGLNTRFSDAVEDRRAAEGALRRERQIGRSRDIAARTLQMDPDVREANSARLERQAREVLQGESQQFVSGAAGLTGRSPESIEAAVSRLRGMDISEDDAVDSLVSVYGSSLDPEDRMEFRAQAARELRRRDQLAMSEVIPVDDGRLDGPQIDRLERNMSDRADAELASNQSDYRDELEAIESRRSRRDELAEAVRQAEVRTAEAIGVDESGTDPRSIQSLYGVDNEEYAVFTSDLPNLVLGMIGEQDDSTFSGRLSNLRAIAERLRSASPEMREAASRALQTAVAGERDRGVSVLSPIALIDGATGRASSRRREFNQILAELGVQLSSE